MTHDPEELEPPGDPRLAGLLSGLDDDDFARTDAPAGLFASIAGRIAADAESERDVTLAGADDGADDSLGGSGEPPVVVRLADRRRTRLLVAAAAAAVVAAGAATIVATRSGPDERLLASATLEQLEPLGRTSATARLVDEDGTTHLVIDASDMAPPPAGSSYELWLIDRKVSDPRSLGTVTGSEDIVVPSSIDPKTYAIVDISLEPDDGDHRHSGHSLMRGTLG